MNVLVVPGTTLVAREICNSIGTSKGIRLFGAGYDGEAARLFPYLRFDFVGDLASKNLLDKLEEIIERREIDLVILAHDSWIYEFRNTESIERAKVMKNSSSVIELCLFKSSTYEFLQKVIPTPNFFKSEDQILAFPVFLKPDRGQGSVGTREISSQEELNPFIDSRGVIGHQWVVSELLTGQEYTVDCFSGLNGELLYSSPRVRLSVISGLAVETRIIEHQELSDWAEKISQKIPIVGPWFFQAKEDSKGSLKLMEIGLRIAGGSSVQRLKGVNLSQLSVLQSQGLSLEIIDQRLFPSTIGNTLNLDFEFEAIYVDYDDTLILNSKKNLALINFLMLSKKKGIKIVLITRHSGNLEKSLYQFELSSFFADIIHLSHSESKSKCINSAGKFLFIDDSFHERHEMSLKFGSRVLVLDETFMIGGKVDK